ncbi:glutathione S-transferase family protein [Allorhizobium borbori]|jgi:glutathione S-transferase|uniref:Glutathione S-transferase n=1 Tax=Allorhizobium borbori TaxID=485907 RepID=A0A7W6K4A8_9HYPH|nr:glutathione S-transferase family protein [Allorhizobium borbori]MBB4104936.1 glutathione S-transferase [Allorhizobium borbori]PZU25063.1 MAG: glutathione S-transferase [Shinella sp.]
MLTIYGAYRSRATRTYWLALELGLDFTSVPVLQARRLENPLSADAPVNTLSPAFLKVNPMGLIPAIDDDGFVVIESMAINLYLARKHGGPLAPATLKEETEASMWSFFAATALETEALRISSTAAAGKLEAEDGKAEVAAASRLLERPLRVLDAHLAATGFVVADRFTVADINVAEIVRYAQPATALIGKFPHVKAWLEKVQARPAFKTMWERRAAEPA